MRLRVTALVILAPLVLGLLFASPVAADSLSVADISKDLVCQCGCGMVLNNCNHVGCPGVESMTASIEQQIAQGRSKGQIVQSFVQVYGDQVLSAPTTRGFNLTAWVLPFVALLFGGVVVYAFLRRWVGWGKRPLELAVESDEVDQEYGRRLDKELEEFTGG